MFVVVYVGLSIYVLHGDSCSARELVSVSVNEQLF